jgi:hypothetical protein
MRFGLLGSLAAIALMTVGVSAQTDEIKSKTKTEIKGGREITTTGCVERMGDGRYGLISSIGGVTQYALVGKDIAKHVGHRVEIFGKATDLGDAKVRTETETKIEREHGKDTEQRVTVEREGNGLGLPLLGVKSVKTLANSCS